MITADAGPGRGHVEVARAALAGGATMVQLRDKEAGGAALYGLAVTIGALCRSAGVPFIVNDRLDVALAADADGVHLGQDDLPALVARRLLGPDKILGVSVNMVEEAKAAVALGADYVGLGPLFTTGTKPDAGPPLTPERFRLIAGAVPVPVIAIGGVTAGNVGTAIAAGADGVAVISAVTRAPDMERAVRNLATAVAGAKGM